MKKIKLGELWKESKIISENPDSNKRIRVKLNVQGVEKRPDKNDKSGATKYFKREAGQFIYGKQNFHKGAFGVIPDELDGFESSSDIPSFDIIQECNPEWLYYFFKQGDFYKELEKYSKGTGSKRIHPDKIAHLEISLPSRDEQDKIIKKIKLFEKEHSDLDSETDCQFGFLIKLRQAILQEAVQGKLVPQNPEDESASVLLEKIKKEKLKLIKEGKIKKQKELPPISEDDVPYELPSGWVWCRLGDLAFYKKGFAFKSKDYRNSGKMITKIKNLTDNNINNSVYMEKKLSKKYEEYELIKGDIVLTTVGSSPSSPLSVVGTSFKISKLFSNSLLNQNAVRIRPFGEIHSFFLYFILNSKSFKNHVIKEEQGTANQSSITQESIKNFIVGLSSPTEQKRIVEKVDALMKLCDELELRVKENKESSEMLIGAVLRESFENGI